MSGLLSIAPLQEDVEVMGQTVTVYGVSVRGLTTILARFPEVRMVMSGKEVDASKLIELAPDAISAIIAAGTGSPGNADIEAHVDRLPVDAQADLLSAIIRVTMPKGIAPFVEKLGALGASLNNVAAPSTEQATKSPKPSKA